MSIARENTIGQLWYTWSTVGFGSTNGFRIRKVSEQLADVHSERVKGLDGFLRYALPPGYDSYATSPEQAPISLALFEAGGERVLLHKNYRGKDPVGRPGNFFAHLLAGLPPTFSARDAASLWRSPFWQTTDTNDQDLLLEPVTLAQLVYAPRAPIDLSGLQQPLTFLILAYLTRQPEQHIYIIAESADTVAALVIGLTRSLPEQLLRDLTFSTYESDLTRASMQIVGTCLRTASERDARAEQTLVNFAQREGLLLDCRQPANNSPLQWETPAARFAAYAAESITLDDTDQLNELCALAQQTARLSVNGFLEAYKHVVEDAQQLSPEKIEFYLTNEPYIYMKLNDRTLRTAIMQFVASDPDWWKRSLKPILTHLKQQSAATPQLADPLFRLARRGIKIAVAAMKASASSQDVLVLETMLDLMETLEPPAPGSKIWLLFLQHLGESTLALHFLSEQWRFARPLLLIWSRILPENASDDLIKQVLWIRWPNYERLLQLQIPLRWKAIATEQLLNDTSQKPDESTIARLNTSCMQHIEQVLGLLITTRPWWATATNLIILLARYRFAFNQACLSLVQQHFQHLLENPQWWKWALVLRNELIHNGIYPKELVLYMVLESGPGRMHAQEQANELLLTTQDKALFLDKYAKGLLTSPNVIKVIVALFHATVQDQYPAKMERLFQLLDHLADERFVPDLLNVANLSLDEAARVLERYGVRYLTSPITAPTALFLFEQLVRGEYPRRIQVLSTLFTPELPLSTLEDLLERAHLRTPEEFAALHKHIGTWYITKAPGSQTMLVLLDTLASQNYPTKLDLVFAWLDTTAPFGEESLHTVLQKARLTPIESVKVLTHYGTRYLAPPHSSHAMFELCVQTLQTQPPEKLALVSMVLAAHVNEVSIHSVLQAANLLAINGEDTRTAQDIKDLFEHYGPQFLAFTLQSPALQQCLIIYLQNVTFDDLSRPSTWQLLQTLSASTQLFQPELQERLQAWYEIGTYIKQPDLAGFKPFLRQLHNLPLRTRARFTEASRQQIAQLCHQLVAQQGANLADIMPAVTSVGLEPRLDMIQLLYSMADYAARGYRRQRQENILLQYIYFLPEVEKHYLLPYEGKQFFVVSLFNTLLSSADPNTFESLNSLLYNGLVQIPEWQTYYERLPKERLLGDELPAPSSHVGRIKAFFTYQNARRHLAWALLVRKPRKIAATWDRYKAILGKNPDNIKGTDYQIIYLAKDFCFAYENKRDDAIVSAYDKMSNVHRFHFTRQEKKRIQSARKSMETPFEQMNQQFSKQAHGVENLDTQTIQSEMYTRWEKQ